MQNARTDSVVVSQLGARMHYAVPRIFAQAGRLEHLYTDICGARGWPQMIQYAPKRLQPASIRRLAGRIPQGIPRDRLTAFNAFGIEYAIKRMRARTPSEETEAAIWGGKRFSELVIRHGFRQATALYTFCGEGLEQLIRARSRGLRTIVEQTNAPRVVLNRLLAEEEEQFPGWQEPTAADRYAGALARREMAEWASADTVICASEFVRSGFIASGGDGRRCVVVPYGVDEHFAISPRRGRTGPLRVLTVGQVGLRKGTPYVLEAARRLKGKVEIRMVGGLNVLPERRAELAESVELIGNVPRSEILAHFAWADVFLLPSICEGSATAVYEALAASLPVVTTPNTGTVVRDEIEGFVVPIRDADRIVHALERLADDADLRAWMSFNAGRRVKEFDLEGYRRRLLEALRITEQPDVRALAV